MRTHFQCMHPGKKKPPVTAKHITPIAELVAPPSDKHRRNRGKLPFKRASIARLAGVGKSFDKPPNSQRKKKGISLVGRWL